MEINSDSILVIKNFIDISDYIEVPPKEKTHLKYFKNGSFENISNNETITTNNCSSRYNYPKYKQLYFDSKKILESILKEKLYPTYYYDRFYYNNSELKPHIDRPSCEISISLNLSSNLHYDWPLFFNLDNEIHGVITNPGDAVIYEGMKMSHWRHKLIGNEKSFYHQMFLHFVRADGNFLEYAYDKI